MQSTKTSSRLAYLVTPIVSVVIGVVYFVAFSVAGRNQDAWLGLALMVFLAVALLLAGRRSETVRGLLDRKDERITMIDLKATAFTAAAMIIAVLIAFVIEVARDGDPWPYAMIGAIGGCAYLLSLVILRLRS